ncbi:MAG: FAD-dependent oxidoreductase [Deltaproteobacteria bacterium]
MRAPESLESPPALRLALPGFSFEALQDPARLPALTEAFDRALREAEPALFARFAAYRTAERAGAPHGLTKPAESELLVQVAGHVSSFVGRLFGVEAELRALREAASADAPRFDLKRDFMVKRVFKKGAKGRPAAGDLFALAAKARPLLARFSKDADSNELAFAAAVLELLRLEAALGKGDAAPLSRWAALREPGPPGDALAEVRAALDLLDRYTFARCLVPEERARLHGWASLELPKAVDHAALVEIVRPDPTLPEAFVGPMETRRRRDGFKLTDRRGERLEIRSEVDYCLYCHEREKDHCSKGFRTAEPAGFKPNPLGIPLAGCPLEERISEMHLLESRGDSLGALAMVCVDNPLLPGTGHRICNDCMKACIFQKQEPVDIPQIETAVLTNVLRLPYGVEIYALLTSWNPLHVRRPEARPYNGKNVLVVGLGPAGYTLAHQLACEGFGVVGVDGLKIEPVPERFLRAPIRDFAELERELDERILSGFGGVSEYGITVRWDKNFLTLLQILLTRRRNVRLYGGIRFGGTLTAEDAWELGFHHVGVAAGAGRPTIVPMKNGLLRGIRQASDFLMALQLQGAFKRESMANLQVRLPAVVIGGGLTAIDTATELAAYYPVQCEKALARFEQLVAERPEAELWRGFSAEERETLQELCLHGRAVRAERARAQAAGEAPDFAKLVALWGGVSIAYRKTLQDSPAYRLNHEEVLKSLEEGIRYVEKMSPVEALADERGAVRAVTFERQAPDEGGKLRGNGELVTLPARTVCVAAGTSPNVTYEREHPGSFELDARRDFFQLHRLVPKAGAEPALSKVPVEELHRPKSQPGFFTSYRGPQGQRISYYGDNHPTYAGSVVKAMASAKDGYPEVVALFEAELSALRPDEQPLRDARFAALAARLDDGLLARVEKVVRLTPTIVEVIVRAPFAARRFEPGQFYRLQNYESLAPRVSGTRLGMEGLALTGAWTDKERGLLSLIVLEMGGSSRLCAALRPGEPVVVMGPTGTPTEIPSGETVLLCGGGLGNAVLFSIARALRERGSKVLYFAGFKRAEDLFKRDEIEAATDQIVWSVDAGAPITPRRPQDLSFVGNIVQAMVAFSAGELGERVAPLSEATRIIAIGSDRMMAAVKDARHGVLAPLLSPHQAVGSINSPMQCMMMEICAQCLQRHVDPQTGKESFVFSCMNQDQELDRVDFAHLNARLRQNGALERLSNAWLDRLLREAPGLVRV